MYRALLISGAAGLRPIVLVFSIGKQHIRNYQFIDVGTGGTGGMCPLGFAANKEVPFTF